MSDFFSVQMNMPDRQIVQAEQSTNKSAEAPTETPENSFNSILKKALPKDNNDTLSKVEASSQDGVSESILPTGTAKKTAPSIDQSLLLSSDHDLKANIRQLLAFLAENTKYEKNGSTLPNVQANPDTNELTIPREQASRETNRLALTNVLANPNVNEITIPNEQVDRETIGIALTNVLANPDVNEINETTIPSEQASRETNRLALTNVLANPNVNEINEITIPNEQVSRETIGIALTNILAHPDVNEITIPSEQASQDTNGIPLTNVLANSDVNEITIPSKQVGRETIGIPLSNALANPDVNEINETTIPSEQINTDFDENQLIDFIKTYFASDTSKDIQQTLKDIRTALTQQDASLSSPSAPAKLDELTFGGLTNNFGELQNLLSGKTGIELPVAPSRPVSLTSQQHALLERIQSFIANGQEAGTLSIKKSQPEFGVSLRNRLAQFSSQIQTIDVNNNSTETSPPIKVDGFTALEEGVFSTTLRSRQPQLSGIRHDSNQQFYDAKTQAQNVMNDSANLSDNQKGDSMNQPGSGFNQMNPSSASPETSNTFSMTNSTSLNPLTAQITDPTKTTMLPSGAVVQDQEVIQQLVERFQVNRRQQDTKIQLKLHPVELGKMEIDLTVKEGSIRANVVAQSQHVQEILERNIAKLRSVLEQQGFDVEEITVTSGSETVGEFDMFDQHLPNQNTSGFLAQNDKTENQTAFSIDISEEGDNETNSGLNVKA